MFSRDPTIDELCESWIAHDWRPESRDVIKHMASSGHAGDYGKLRYLMSPRITFGTAGLRAEMLPGFAMMNHVTGRQTALGLADYLVDQLGTSARSSGVVVGHCHRGINLAFSNPDLSSYVSPRSIQNFTSKAFAQLVAATLEHKGFNVLWLGMCHTPLVSYAIKDLQAAGGVMVTASHNPKTYNGLKVYWRNCCQINQPHDAGISASIERNLQPPSHEFINESPNTLVNVRSTFYNKVDVAYYSSISKLVDWPFHRRVKSFVFTALHGVGSPPCTRAISAVIGSDALTQCIHVPSQDRPDPGFPTVKFPNPEEEGALDEAMQVADRSNCDFLVAVDPDADRFACAERKKDGWHRFTGNQIGVLLAAYMLEKMEWASVSLAERGKIVMLTSAVSTFMLKRMADVEGFYYEETLTGFKWMGNRTRELESQGYRVLFAFEEALGYMFPEVVYDKDGIAAMMVFLAARQKWADEGLTVQSKLDSLYQKYGYFADVNTYVTSPSPTKTNEIFSKIRETQKRYGAGTKEKPAVLAGSTCTLYRDLTTGVDTSQPDSKAKLPTDQKSHMITCIEDDCRFTIRGSGTEPKIKLYIEAQKSCEQDAYDKASAVKDTIINDWLSELTT